MSTLSDHLSLVDAPLPRFQTLQPGLDLVHHGPPKGLMLLLATLDLFDRVFVSQPGGLELGGDGVRGFGQGDGVLGFDLVELHAGSRRRRGSRS